MKAMTTEHVAIGRIPVDEFPALEHGHYVNHAAISPWPRVASDAVQVFAQDNARYGPVNYHRWLARETQLRDRLARLLNAASADDIALLKNTTEGISTVANGLNWRKGDNVVLPLGEFPSNRLPWLALQSLGVEVREVDIRLGDDPEANLMAHMDDRTRLLSVSAVQWTDGLRLQLESLGQACRQNNTLFFVDAIQQLGAVQLDVQACGIDFLAADGHKWLLAPEGVAVFYCRQSVREQLLIQQLGWHMVDNAYRFNREEWLPSESARRFEAGSPNNLGQVALHACAGLLLDVGMQHVEACIGSNSLALSDGLTAIPGVELVRPYDPGRMSGIVSFRPPGGNPDKLYQLLKQRQVITSVRGDAIRLSPHFYQAGKPIQELLSIIETCISL